LAISKAFLKGDWTQPFGPFARIPLHIFSTPPFLQLPWGAVKKRRVALANAEIGSFLYSVLPPFLRFCSVSCIWFERAFVFSHPFVFWAVGFHVSATGNCYYYCPFADVSARVRAFQFSDSSESITSTEKA
jgi:hypothetical protein